MILAAAIAAAVLLRLFVFEAFRIPSRSMEPTLLAGDFVIVNKLPYPRAEAGGVYAFRAPAIGDIDRGNEVFVKRCVAVPGDTVAVTDGAIRVNGKTVRLSGSDVAGPRKLAGIRRTWVIPRAGEEIPLNDSSVSRWRSLIEREGHRIAAGPSGEVLLDETPATAYRVEQNHYFVAGDNPADSFDSRYWGLLPERAIVGRAVLVYWSWDDGLSAVRWGRMGTIVR